MKILFTLSLAFILLGEATNAQTFHKSVGRTSFDYPMHMIELSGGGYAVSGTMGDDVFLMRMDSEGDTLWVKSYNNPKMLAGSWVDQTQDGGFVIIGDAHLNIDGSDQEIILIRTDANGTEQWTKTYGGSGKDYGTAIDATSDAYFLAGAVGISQYDTEGIVIKTGIDGVVIWQRAIVGVQAENINAVVATGDGGCIAVGTTNSYLKGLNGILVTRFSADGDTEWSGIYNDGGNCYGFGMDVLEDGSGYIISGATTGSGAASYDALMLKINTDFSIAWAKIYGGSDFDTAVKPVDMGEDGFAALGQTYSFGTESDLFLIRTNSDGELTWAKAYGGDGYEFGEGLLALSDGFLVSGGEESFGANRDVYFVRCDSQGNSGCNQVSCKLSTSDSNMQMMEEENVTSFNITSGEQSHNVILGAELNTYCETISVYEEVDLTPIIYPNPCNEFFALQGTTSGGNLAVYDVTGKIVFENTTTFGTTTVDMSKLTDGVYMVWYLDESVTWNHLLMKK
ncbi:MAG: T9SS type A sorting domain-containing protein [Flavobacteriales bacterium]